LAKTRAYGATGARLVVHNHAAAQLGAQAGGHHAGHRIGRAARGIGHDEGDGPLGEGGVGQACSQGAGGDQGFEKTQHEVSLSIQSMKNKQVSLAHGLRNWR
jgi:hypothetical protein